MRYDSAMLSWIRSHIPGPTVCIAFGVHGDERAPIVAGRALAESFTANDLACGAVLFLLGNPEAVAADRRFLDVDLNRCFTPEALARSPRHAEEQRAQVLAEALSAVDVLVDFHCTVEPGERFVMHHPDDAAHRHVAALLDVGVTLSDPDLFFGGCSLDEHLSTRGRVGVCYETGWIGDPDNSPTRIQAEMRNVLVGLGVLPGDAVLRHDARALRLVDVLRCPASGFAWAEGVGENLQALAAGTLLGTSGDGTPLRLSGSATLVFPKKRPHLLRPGQPLVYLAAAG